MTRRTVDLGRATHTPLTKAEPRLANSAGTSTRERHYAGRPFGRRRLAARTGFVKSLAIVASLAALQSR